MYFSFTLMCAILCHLPHFTVILTAIWLQMYLYSDRRCRFCWKLTRAPSHEHANTSSPLRTHLLPKTTHANFIIRRLMPPSVFPSLPFYFLRLKIADGNAEASYWGIWNTERMSSFIQEMMAGPNMILNRTRGDARYKSILIPNDDHHLEHILRAHCCLNVWLS